MLILHVKLNSFSLCTCICTLTLSVSAPKLPQTPYNPCMPSPCGSNSECRVVDKRPVCSCLPGMLGAPPNCRPECIIHADCPTKLACVQNKCRDPCAGSCGFNTHCTVVNHQPVCACLPGYQGDPFSGCNPVKGNAIYICSSLVVEYVL